MPRGLLLSLSAQFVCSYPFHFFVFLFSVLTFTLYMYEFLTSFFTTFLLCASSLFLSYFFLVSRHQLAILNLCLHINFKYCFNRSALWLHVQRPSSPAIITGFTWIDTMLKIICVIAKIWPLKI